MYKVICDQNDIIIGFTPAYIDPLATQKKAIEILENSKIKKELLEYKTRCEQDKTPGNLRRYIECQQIYQQMLKQKMEENTVYLEQPKGDKKITIITDDEFDRLFALTRKHAKVKITGEVIDKDGP